MDIGESYMLYVGSHGIEDPTRAGLLFAAANAAARYAKTKGVKVKVALLGDAVFLLNTTIAANTKPAGRASLKDLIREAVDLGVGIHC